jgi:hypothetical protein
MLQFQRGTASYKGCSESDLQWTVGKTSSEKEIVIYILGVHKGMETGFKSMQMSCRV